MSGSRASLRLLGALAKSGGISQVASAATAPLVAASLNGVEQQLARTLPSLWSRSLVSSAVTLAERAPTPDASNKASTSQQQAPAGEQQQQQQAEQQAAGPGPSAEELRLKQVLEGIKTGYANVKAGFETAKSTAANAASSAAAGLGNTSSSSSSEGAGAGASGTEGSSTSGSESADGSAAPSSPGLFGSVVQEVKATLSPVGGITSATRIYKGPLMEDMADYEGTVELMVVKQEETAWQKTWRTFTEKLPFLKNLGSVKVTDTSMYRKGQEIVDDIKDKYETSDHPAVHKVEEVKERFTTGSEATRAMHEIRTRDPNFDINRFVQAIKLDAPLVTKAFLTHDLPTLKDHCGPELIERFSGIFKHFADQGLVEDPTILYVGEVDIVEVRLVDEDPFIIAQFNCQQLKCTRDKFGNVVEGSPDTIQRVYYFWGLQMEKTSVVTLEGKVLPPRWAIKDMMWQSMLALV